MKKNLVLLGMMGVGKSTLGKIVAKKLDLKFVDTDLNIEKKWSMKIWEIFQNMGENFFRIEEEKEVLECLKKNKTVLALGGGAFLNKKLQETPQISASFPRVLVNPFGTTFLYSNQKSKTSPNK